MDTVVRIKANMPWEGQGSGLMYSGYNRLAQAVILQAVIDYIKLQRELLSCPLGTMNYRSLSRKSDEIENFFNSEFFLIFSEFKAATVIEICRKRAKEMDDSDIARLGRMALKSESKARSNKLKRIKNAENIDETTGGINT